MKITWVAPNYPPSVGGAQEHVRQLAEGLAARGHEVDVVTTDALLLPTVVDPGRIPVRREVLRGVAVARYPVAGRAQVAQRAVRLYRRVRGRLRGDRARRRPSHPLVFGPHSVRLVLAVRRALASGDVVVGCSAPMLTLVAGPWLRGRGRAALVSMPLLHLRPEGFHPLVAESLRRSDAVAASTEVEGRFHLAAGVPANSLQVLPPGTDPTEFREVTPAEARQALGLPERPTVGYVGRLAPHKGIDTLLDAAALIWQERPDVTVVVAGSAVRSEALDELLAERGADERLVVRSGFTDEERPLWYAACDVVAFPTRDESFGMTTSEAWAARRPVVASDLPVIRSVIRPGIDGLLVPVDDAAALAGAVGELLADPARAAAMGLAGRARAEGELSWAVVVEGWERLLERTVDARRRATGAGAA